MKRRLLNLLTAVSLLLCVAVVAVHAHAFVAGRSRVIVRETVDAVYLADVEIRSIRVISMSPARGNRSDRNRVRLGGETRVVLDLPLKLLTTVSGALPALWFGRWLRRGSVHAGVCPACGYDLTGNVSGVCPECGRGR